MELGDEQHAPRLGELGARVRRAPEPRGDGGEQLGVVERGLAAAVAALERGLGRVRAAVVLEVQLADDRPQLARAGLEAVEERLGMAERRARQPAQVAGAAQALEHRAGRPAAAVAVAEDEQAVARAVVVVVGADAAAQLGDGRLGVVGVVRREVGEHLAAVDPLPGERVVLGRVEAVPRELLREEPRDARLAHELRELAGVAEDVGLPELRASPAELALEEALAVQELAGERLARGQVAVGLDPRPADRRPLAARDALADVVPERRVVLADPRVVLGLRGAEDVLGVLVHEPHLRRERPLRLAPALLERPEPGGVEVRVADRGELVRPAVGVALVQRGEDRAGRPPGGAVPGVPGVAEVVEAGEQLARERGVDAVLALQRAERGEVEAQAPGVGVEAGELAGVEDERRARPVAAARALADDAEPEGVVAGDLERERDGLSPARGLDQRRVGARLARGAVEALDRPPADPERRLAAGVGDQVDAGAGPVRRHGGRDAQPVGGEQRPELGAERDGRVVERVGLRGGDPVDRAGDLERVDGRPLGADERGEALLGPAQAVARVVAVREHVRRATLRDRRSAVACGGGRRPRPHVSGSARIRGTGDGSSHSTLATAPIPAIHSVGCSPIAAPSAPPPRAPIGRTP